MGFFKKLSEAFGTANPKTTLTAASASDARQITLIRVFEFNRQTLWEMWTKPEKLCQWFGVPPIAATPETTKIDLRVGGSWQADMVNAQDGTRLPFSGTYLEIQPPRKLVFTIQNPVDPSSKEVETVSVTFVDRAGSTEMTLHQEGHLPPEQYGEPLRNGYSAFFDRMAKYLRVHN